MFTKGDRVIYHLAGNDLPATVLSAGPKRVRIQTDTGWQVPRLVKPDRLTRLDPQHICTQCEKPGEECDCEPHGTFA